MGCKQARQKRRKNKNNRVNEGKIIGSHVEEVDQYLTRISRSICKIKTKNMYGSGFFLKLSFDNDNTNYFKCLMTNEHIITEEIIQSNDDEIEVSFDFNKKIIIPINTKQRYIKAFNKKNINLDITVVQILSSDNIEDSYFLSP